MLLPIVLAWRLLNAFSVYTFFQPDEYFQALEPAHALVYGYGYLTWEWHQKLRSSLHPLLYAAAYKIGQLTLPDNVAVAVAPRIVGAIVAALGDYYTSKFAARYWNNPKVGQIAVAISMASSWNFYTATRSFSNNLEMTLTAIGLSYWPWHHFKLSELLKACTFGFLSCVVRPTNSVLWGYLAAVLVIRNFGKWRRLARILVASSVLLAVVLAVSASADRFFYGEWTFPLWNFLEFNVVKNLSLFYGSAPWHFYLFQGLPLMLMAYLPFCMVSAYNHRHSVLVHLSLFVIAAFSYIGHKEFRFLQPLYPVLLALTSEQMHRTGAFSRNWFVVLLCTLHFAIAIFFTQINERGEIDVVNFLKHDPNVTSVGFLTPCHSTPWHATMHRPELVENSWFLTCEPPLHLNSGNLENIRAYRDESDRFFDDPQSFLSNFPYPWPSHLVIFEPMEQVIDENLPSYRQCHRFFNSFFHWDSRRSGDILLYCKE